MTKLEDANRLDPDALQKPILRILRPLVSLMIRAGIPFPTFVDLVKTLYVQTAENEFSLPAQPITDSRISLITGVHRKDVRRLRDTFAETETVSAHLSLTGRLMTRWLGSPRFTDEAGRPRALPRTAKSDEASFDELVAFETKDVHPRSILDEWTSRGLASIMADDTIVLVVAALVPAPGAAEQLHFFGRNLHDHAAAAVMNVIGPQPVHFDRSVHYDNLTETDARALAEASRRLAMESLTTANREAQTVRATGERGDWRWNFGLYVYLEQAQGSATAGSRAPGTAGE